MSRVFRKSLLRDWRFWGVAIWFCFTISLASWQAIFSRQTLEQLSSADPAQSELMARHTQMVWMESLTMLALLLLGGGALTVLIIRARAANESLREFFATFTHEIKTSLASLRLQVEVLEDSLARAGAGHRAERILSDLTRIELQLENSLQLARSSDEKLFAEDVSIKEMLSGLQHSFPIPIHLNRDCRLRVDRRAFESILKNLAQNATLHGKAQNLYFDVHEPASSGLITLHIEDDGTGASVDASQLGKLFYRPLPTSKNGIGLHLVSTLSERMGGRAEFVPSGQRGFAVVLTLPGASA